MTSSAADQAVSSPSGFVERCEVTAVPAGPLKNVRLAIKDNIQVRDLRYTAGHPLFSERRAEHTAPAVQALLNAGATIVGMTCTDAGGLGVTTPGVINPVAPGIIVGGSSGGAAAAIAADQADLALGTDTGGSVRIPAACTGLFAYKPDYSSVSTRGTWPLAPSFDHVGFIARTGELLFRAVRTMPGLLSVQAGTFKRTSIRVGIESSPLRSRDPDISAAVNDAARSLSSTGYTLVPITLPDRDLAVEAHGVITLSEAKSVYRHLTENEIQRLGPAAIRAFKSARGLTAQQVGQAIHALAHVREHFAKLFSEVDVILLPTLSFPPPRLGTRKVTTADCTLPVTLALIYETCGFNVYGGPVMTFPYTRFDPVRSIPISLQAAVARCSDSHHLTLFQSILDDLSAPTQPRTI